MSALIRVEGGPHLGLIPVEPPLQATIALGVNEDLARDDGPQPYAYAIYEPQGQAAEPVYVFRAFGRDHNQPFMVEFVGGPKSGIHALPQPPATFGPQVRCLLTADGALHEGSGPVGGVAIYERRWVGRAQKYVLASLDDNPQSATHATQVAGEDRLENAIKGFYETPNYDIYTTKPTDRHQQVLVHLGHRRAHVDAGIASVIRELFRLGLDTIGSCQEQAKGEPFEGQAYIGFCRERDARRFYNILTSGGINATFKPKKLKIVTRRSTDEPPEDQIVPSGNVMFPSCQIERITQLLRSEI
ncbi:MAG: hypothetical protein L0Y44_16445 [Phycisphaerales bacterium]|nr:hypothetical protein [Phycisphaerales bacterium]